MKNFVYYILLTLLLAPGCYYSTIKKDKPKPAPVKDSAAHASAIPEAEFKRYYNASEEFYENILEKSHFSGEFLVAKKGEIIFEKYAGYGHLNTKDPLNAASALHLASVSKTFTGRRKIKDQR
jgi:CubicO group peptidase (beta-lactamase class C family)